jgi:hypothetical protein
MQSTTFSAGDPIEARCTKCRKNTAHVIVTLADGVPAQVQCGTCKRQHKYRPPTATRKTAVRRTFDPKVAARKEWEDLRPGMDSAEATDYSMNAACKVGELIKHPVFGLGLVQQVVGPQKVEVLFEDGKKKMRCK